MYASALPWLKRYRTAAVQLILLTQDECSLEDHISVFISLKNQVHFPDDSLIAFFVAGLNEPLKSLLFEFPQGMLSPISTSTASPVRFTSVASFQPWPHLRWFLLCWSSLFSWLHLFHWLGPVLWLCLLRWSRLGARLRLLCWFCPVTLALPPCSFHTVCFCSASCPWLSGSTQFLVSQFSRSHLKGNFKVLTLLLHVSSLSPWLFLVPSTH